MTRTKCYRVLERQWLALIIDTSNMGSTPSDLWNVAAQYRLDMTRKRFYPRLSSMGMRTCISGTGSPVATTD